jgi:hypothetical protein
LEQRDDGRVGYVHLFESRDLALPHDWLNVYIIQDLSALKAIVSEEESQEIYIYIFRRNPKWYKSISIGQCASSIAACNGDSARMIAPAGIRATWNLGSAVKRTGKA